MRRIPAHKIALTPFPPVETHEGALKREARLPKRLGKEILRCRVLGLPYEFDSLGHLLAGLLVPYHHGQKLTSPLLPGQLPPRLHYRFE